MNEELDKLADKLAEDGEKTEAFFRSLSPGDWAVQVYSTGSRWSARHILAHFVSAERSFHLLIRDVASGGDGAPRGLDIDEFNEAEVPKLEDRDIPELLDDYMTARRISVRITRALDPSDLEHQGFHPWFGEVSLRKMLKLIYRHNMIHRRDVRKAIDQGGPVPHREVEVPAQSQND